MSEWNIPRTYRLGFLTLAVMLLGALPALGQITVTASADPSIGQAPLTVQLSASASIWGFPPTDPTWSWDFGDGTSGTGQTVHHTYLEPGTYRAVVFMTDWPPFPSDSP